MNEPQLSVELADGVMEIIDRHGENTSEGGIYWNKEYGWDKKGSTAYNAEEECKKEVQSFLAQELERQREEYVEAVKKLPVNVVPRMKVTNYMTGEATRDDLQAIDVRDVLAILKKARE